MAISNGWRANSPAPGAGGACSLSVGCRRIGHPLIVIVRIYMVAGSVKSTLGHAFRFVGLTYASQPLAHAVPFARLCTDVGG